MDQADIIEVIESISALISVIACLFIIFVCLTSKFLRRGYPYKYIFILSIIDLIWTSNRLIPPTNFESKNYCIFQACINQSFHLISILWTGLMSLEMYNVTIRNKRPENFGFKRPLLFIITFSSLFCIPPFLLKKFGKAQGWCWIAVEKNKPLETCLYRILFFYFFAWTCIAWNTFVAIKARKELKIKFGTEDHATIRQLKKYPIVLLICYIPMSFYRMIDPWVEIPEWVSCFFVIIANLEGFFNVLVFGLNQDVRKHLKKCCKKHAVTNLPLVDLA